MNASSATEYRALARRYRPTMFEDLVGQDVMTRTLRNAFASGRIAHAYLFSGARGVGKTTTARLLARALNYEGDAPSIEMKEVRRHCEAILEGRHVDVLEMDAASRTGIDDIRELIESARYRPMEARYKVYVLDEAHMLSTQAFNGLLKTLEEPPERVVFVFATTEPRKVPLTVLSRCQRFDLRRLETDVAAGLLARVAQSEGVEAEQEALETLARAGGGSARDALSLLEMAIVYGEGRVGAEAVEQMLGLGDGARVWEAWGMALRGEPRAALEALATARTGDPARAVEELARFAHAATLFKALEDSDTLARGMPPAQRDLAQAAAKALSMGALSQAWQMALRGLEEMNAAPDPWMALEMLAARVSFAADLPDVAALAAKAAATSAAPSTATSTATSAATSAGRGVLDRVKAEAEAAMGAGSVREASWISEEDAT